MSGSVYGGRSLVAVVGEPNRSVQRVCDLCNPAVAVDGERQLADAAPRPSRRRCRPSGRRSSHLLCSVSLELLGDGFHKALRICNVHANHFPWKRRRPFGIWAGYIPGQQGVANWTS